MTDSLTCVQAKFHFCSRHGATAETACRGLPRTPWKLSNGLEKAQLVGVRGVRNAAVAAIIGSSDKGWIANLEQLQSRLAAAGEPLLLPDLIEPAGVAAIAAREVDGADAQPARDPDVDGIGLRQTPRREHARRCRRANRHLVCGELQHGPCPAPPCGRHTLDARQERRLIAHNDSNLMAPPPAVPDRGPSF
jgi:hypothetical protein